MKHLKCKLRDYIPHSSQILTPSLKILSLHFNISFDGFQHYEVKSQKIIFFCLCTFASLRSAAATRLQLFYYVLIHFRLLISSLLLLDLTECTQDLVGPSKTDLGYEVRTQYNFASTHASWCDNDNLLQVLRIEDILPADNVTYDKNKPPTFRQVETPPRLQS